MTKKIIIIAICMLFYANLSFAWTTTPSTINKIKYDKTDVIVNFTDQSDWTANKMLDCDNETQLKIMLSILLTAKASGDKCKLTIVSGMISKVEITNE